MKTLLLILTKSAWSQPVLDFISASLTGPAAFIGRALAALITAFALLVVSPAGATAAARDHHGIQAFLQALVRDEQITSFLGEHNLTIQWDVADWGASFHLGWSGDRVVSDMGPAAQPANLLFRSDSKVMFEVLSGAVGFEKAKCEVRLSLGKKLRLARAITPFKERLIHTFLMGRTLASVP